MSADLLGEKVNVTSKHIYDLEKARKKPSYELIIGFSEALEVPVGDLFSKTEIPSPKEQPVSIFIKKLSSVPDKVYEAAGEIGPDHVMWKRIIELLEDTAKDEREKKAKKVSQSRA